MTKRYLTVEQRRAAIKLAYSDRNWIDKVDSMPTKQICGIFDNLKKIGMINFDERGNIFFRSKEEVKELKKRRQEAHNGHQITLEEYMKEKENITNGKDE